MQVGWVNEEKHEVTRGRSQPTAISSGNNTRINNVEIFVVHPPERYRGGYVAESNKQKCLKFYLQCIILYYRRDFRITAN
jgi:hypothetical protein